MSRLQLVMVVVAAVIVAVVYGYNLFQERRLRRKLDRDFGPQKDVLLDEEEPAGRREPKMQLEREEGAEQALAVRPGAPAKAGEEDFSQAREPPGRDAPDARIECVVALSRVRVPREELQRLSGSQFGKPARWLAREGGQWRALESDRAYAEGAACILLANRSGPVSAGELEAFFEFLRKGAGALWSAPGLPRADREVMRAVELDRACAELDVQVGLSVVRRGGGLIAGSRLREAAEAAGLRLNERGQFEAPPNEAGVAPFVMVEMGARAFTADMLKHLQTRGLTLLLDTPTIADPPAAFDRMCAAARELAAKLDAGLVDDERQSLSEEGLARIRARIEQNAASLRGNGIDPGGGRALRLFA